MASLMRLLGLVAATVALAPRASSAFSLRRLEFQALMASPPLNCFIENGYDYVGNDLTNVPGAVETCCAQCANYDGCKAWSWSNHNGGTCWLKWARGDVIVNPNVKSALLSFSVPQYCQLQNDLDYVGNDLTRVDGAKAGDCCELCQKYPGCRAYSWSDYMGGSCWLKSKVTQTAYKAGVKSARAYPEPDNQPSCPNLEYGFDYVDNDIDNKPAVKAELCCDICKATNNCKAFSWSGHNGGTCWLKSAKGATVYTPGVISAQVYPNPQCLVKDNTDYTDNDIGNKPAAKAELCCDICKGWNGCKAFSWSDHNGGTCWLKSAKGTPVTKNGVKSGPI